MNSSVHALFAKLRMSPPTGITSVSGGSINNAYCVESDDGKLFLKVNSATRFPQMFEAEKAGLNLLANSEFVIPNVLAVEELNEQQFILMQWIDQESLKDDFWNVFGQNLAQLHSLTNMGFGLNHDNYIGSLPQRNSEKDSWADFYREERVKPQIELADKNNLLSAKMKRGFDGLFKRLSEIYPIEKPSLLHGDLWSGNVMAAKGGLPCIFDPAVYYGHREMDLAMMLLFGGFGDAWIDSYNEIYPLESGWQKRIEIGQLYPLMVHVNLFGGSYIRSVESILQKFI